MWHTHTGANISRNFESQQTTITHLLGRAGENEISRERKSRGLRELHVNSAHVPSEKSESRTGSGREVLTCCRGRRVARSHRGCGAIENNERVHCLHTRIYESRQNLFSPNLRRDDDGERERVAAAPRCPVRTNTYLLYANGARYTSAGPINRQTTTETRADRSLSTCVCWYIKYGRTCLPFQTMLASGAAETDEEVSTPLFSPRRRAAVAARALEGREDAPKKIVTKN
jgi:hypothetical protein